MREKILKSSINYKYSKGTRVSENYNLNRKITILEERDELINLREGLGEKGTLLLMNED